MNILAVRNTNLGVIESRFVAQALNNAAKGMRDDMEKQMRIARVIDREKMAKKGRSKNIYRTGYYDPKFNKGEKFVVSDYMISFSGDIGIRFSDMKNRRTRGKKGQQGVLKRMRNHPVYNKPIFTNKRFLERELRFGFTEEVKESFRRNLQEFS